MRPEDPFHPAKSESDRSAMKPSKLEDRATPGSVVARVAASPNLTFDDEPPSAAPFGSIWPTSALAMAVLTRTNPFWEPAILVIALSRFLLLLPHRKDPQRDRRA